MKRLFDKIRPLQKRQLMIAMAFCFAALVVAIIWDYKMSEKNEVPGRPEPESVETASTYIPEGFVLVPIEVANYESLDSILGKFGVVDLFIASDNPGQRPHKLAERVKILRAPLNPSHFAVLVPDSESQKIVAYSGALTVVVQNPRDAGPTLVKTVSDGRTPGRGRQAKRSRVVMEVLNVD